MALYINGTRYVITRGTTTPAVQSETIPQLATVNAIQRDDDVVDTLYKAAYSEIGFTTNLTKEQILEQMNDLYITLSTFRKTKKSKLDADDNMIQIRTRSTYRILNDRRAKLDKKMYCYVIGESVDPQENKYFYLAQELNTKAEILDTDAIVFNYFNNMESGIATCLDALNYTGLCPSDYFTDADNIQRAPQYDINTVCKSSAFEEFNSNT